MFVVDRSLSNQDDQVRRFSVALLCSTIGLGTCSTKRGKNALPAPAEEQSLSDINVRWIDQSWFFNRFYFPESEYYYKTERSTV